MGRTGRGARAQAQRGAVNPHPASPRWGGEPRAHMGSENVPRPTGAGHLGTIARARRATASVLEAERAPYRCFFLFRLTGRFENCGVTSPLFFYSDRLVGSKSESLFCYK